MRIPIILGCILIWPSLLHPEACGPFQLIKGSAPTEGAGPLASLGTPVVRCGFALCSGAAVIVQNSTAALLCWVLL